MGDTKRIFHENQNDFRDNWLVLLDAKKLMHTILYQARAQERIYSIYEEAGPHVVPF